MTYNESPNRANTFGWVDSMSITQVIQAFSVWPNDAFPDGWSIPVAVTGLFICTDKIGLAPGLSGIHIASTGSIGLVTRELIKAGILTRPVFTELAKKTAIYRTRGRANRYRTKLKEKYDKFLRSCSQDVARWMHWSIQSASVEHVQNFGSLIDKEFIPQIAQILNATENDLLELHRLTSSLDIVKDFARRQPDSSVFNMICQCFLLGSLLRGVYHDNLARQESYQVTHHPFREVLLPKITSPALSYEQTSVESYLTNIVLHSALSEKNLETRLLRWADNIGRIRAMNRPGYEEIDLRQKKDPALAKKEAIKAAKTVGIEVHPWWFEEFVNVTHALAISGAGFLLHPFAGFVLGPLNYFTSRKTNVGKRVAQGIYARSSRLSQLAQSPPGRISNFTRKKQKLPGFGNEADKSC